jgi:hypothetical protein
VGRETNKQRRARQAVSAREKAAAARAIQKRAEQRRRALTILSSVVALAIVGVVVAVIAIHSTKKNDPAGNRTPAAASVVDAVTSVAPATFSQIGAGSAQLAIQKISTPPLTANGKPELLYIGGEFCPICAAERWSMVTALSRFGTFSGLTQVRSAVTDGNLATLSFFGSKYTSKYLTFTPVENVDRDRQPLMKLSSQELGTYKAAAGTSQLAYPFLDFGGSYMLRTEGYNGQSVLGTKTQAQIAAALKDPSSDVAKAVVGEANNLTAAICGMTNNKPGAVCKSPTITGIQSRITSA